MTANAVAGHADATVEEIWRRFGSELRGFVARRVADPYRAEDVVSEILLRVHRSLHTLDDQDRLAAWLFRIARNAITDEYRRAGARRELLDAAPAEHLTAHIDTDPGDPDGDSVQRELAGCLRPLLDELAPAYRRALQLTDLDGVSQPAAAFREGITVSGMKSRVQRGRRQLADLLHRCCALTLDTRGMPMDYTPSGPCRDCD